MPAEKFDEIISETVGMLIDPDLEPWQQTFIERILDPDFRWPTLDEQMIAARRQQRRYFNLILVTRALIAGDEVIFDSSNAESQQIYDDAVALAKSVTG